MDLREWIVGELEGTARRFDGAIAAHVPLERWREQPGGGSCIAALVFHTTWHADLALATAVRAEPPLLDAWRAPLGLATTPRHAGLGETEDPEVTARLDLDALVAYAAAAQAAHVDWLRSCPLDRFDDVPPAGQRIATLAGVSQDAVPWLHAMWTGQPVSFFVQWEVVGHRLNHLGEMIAVRGRLGLSPF